MWRRGGWGARAAEAFTFTEMEASRKVPQNNVCFLFAPVLFCPQSFQQAILLHSRSRGLGVRQHERLIKSDHSVQVDLRQRIKKNYVSIKFTIWYYLATFIAPTA